MPAPTEPIPLDVRRATVDDLAAVVRLLHDAYDWLIAQGITDQWTDPFPVDSIRQLIDHGEVYVASRADAMIATFTLTYRPDPEFWDDPPADAGYIRRLAVHREHAGRNLGARLLDHAACLVAATGRRWLRLDCAKHNTRLHCYYRAHGFTHLRTVDLPHRESGALFQRPATLPWACADRAPTSRHRALTGDTTASSLSRSHESEAPRTARPWQPHSRHPTRSGPTRSGHAEGPGWWPRSRPHTRLDVDRLADDEGELLVAPAAQEALEVDGKRRPGDTATATAA